jgi:photosystem II stability/assembly factor-like uncharacterized protein
MRTIAHAFRFDSLLRRGFLAALAAAAALLLMTGCGSAPGGATPASAVTSATHPATAISTRPATSTATSGSAGPASPACAAGRIGPIGASFVSANDGYLLGITLKDCWADATSKLRLRKTTDGGLRWTPLTAPPAPWGGIAPDGTGRVPADGVTGLLFADARDGWAYGPGLWATHDGGASWHRIGTKGWVVQSMASTGGHVVAVLESCDAYDANCGARSFAVRTSPAARDAWRPVPGATGQGTPSVVARDGKAFLVVSAAGEGSYAKHDTLLSGPADGSARWTSRTIPCTPGANALSATTASHLMLSCAMLGAHPASTHIYTSADAGRHWTKIATLGMFDGASTVERTGAGTLLVAGIYDGVALSRDGGRTWTWPSAIDRSDNVGGGGAIEAGLFTNNDGFVIVAGASLWITSDAGRTWRPITVR